MSSAFHIMGTVETGVALRDRDDGRIMWCWPDAGLLPCTRAWHAHVHLLLLTLDNAHCQTMGMDMDMDMGIECSIDGYWDSKRYFGYWIYEDRLQNLYPSDGHYAWPLGFVSGSIFFTRLWKPYIQMQYCIDSESSRGLTGGNKNGGRWLFLLLPRPI